MRRPTALLLTVTMLTVLIQTARAYEPTDSTNHGSKAIKETRLYAYRIIPDASKKAQYDAQSATLAEIRDTADDLKLTYYTLNIAKPSTKVIYDRFVVKRYGEPKAEGFSLEENGDIVLQWIVYYED